MYNTIHLIIKGTRMTKTTLLSLATATLLFTACGEDAKKAVSDVAASATETIKDTASKAVEATKEAASSAVEATKAKAAEVADAAKVEAERLAATAAEKAAEAKAAAAKKAEEAAASLKERAAAVSDTVRETASSAVDSTKEMATATTAAAASAVDTVKETATEVVAPAENVAGKAAFAKCAGCHGANGKTKALGKSEMIAGQSAADLEAKLTEYKAGTRNVAGMGMLMKGQVASMDEAGIKAVSEYISGL